MMNEFEMSAMGLLHYFLGLEVHQDEDGIFLSQRKYDRDFLIKFSLLNCKPTTTPMKIGEKLQLNDRVEMDDARSFRSLVGGLIYLTHTQPDIAFFVGVISRLYGFTGSDYAGSLDDRRSISAHVFTLGSGVVTWSSKKQATTTLSISEVEYSAATSAACQAIWL
ncbi:uncharacterized mitochondrial protein AtMg00810-like [Capsicum annuum]|uniref:uncharacterized mitochondrial protein AtMg00810-like n=1 Tax=Capsicum annuum TaxID=4072 RepID=UPI001FB12A4B|nr:uncharacterized mitochondrial protein AtMg00810-like [Capsicum annuum]